MEQLSEGRRSNVIYVLGQIKGFLNSLKEIEGANISEIYDTVARQFQKALEGASDPYAVIRAVDEIQRTRGVGSLYNRIYRRYFPAAPQVSDEEAEVAADQGFEKTSDKPAGDNIDWPEEVSMRTAEPDEEGGEGDYFADDSYDMDEPDKIHESINNFLAGEDSFSQAYDDADEFLNDGWPRDEVELYLMRTYKDLTPEDINEIVDSIKMHNVGPGL